jgi:hypothetical protein
MARHVETEIDIQASADVVWDILTDFDRIAEWNDFIRHIEGERKIGSKLTVELWLGKRRPMTFKPRLVAYEPDREFRWLGRVLVPGLFDGEHAFAIEPLPEGGVRFVHSETFGGLLVPLMFGSMESDILASFHKMNKALKKRAEARMAAVAESGS